MKQYILLLSSVFPFTHRRKGEYTYFEDKISNAGVKVLFDNWCSELIPEREYPQTKIHTIRSNYPL